MKKLLIVFFLLALGAMGWATVTASFERSVVSAIPEIWQTPWARATLFDAYFAFLTVYVWIFYRERSPLARVGWLISILLLGTFAIAAYFLRALVRADSWHELFQPAGRI